MRIVPVAVMLVLAVAAVGAAQPPDGERLYRQNCARCHEGNLPLLFSSGPIREYPAERVYEALSAGIMAAQLVWDEASTIGCCSVRRTVFWSA